MFSKPINSQPESRLLSDISGSTETGPCACEKRYDLRDVLHSGSSHRSKESDLDGFLFSVGMTMFCHLKLVFTLPETNTTPENRPSQKETSLPTIHF